MDFHLPSGLVNSLKVGKEMKVWDTDSVGSRTQAMSLGLQDFMQRTVSERSSLAALREIIKTHASTQVKRNAH